MIQSFADETSADLFRERNTRHARAIPQGVWPVVRRTLKMLDVAATLDDLRVPPGNKRGRLAGRRAGLHSIRVNAQYRVTFKWEGGHAWHVAVEDYH